jgi:hypothetical protein
MDGDRLVRKRSVVCEEFSVLEELTVLQDVRIASPCTASWEAMQGSEQVRFCDQCQLHVHNLSAMSPLQAASLVQEAEGRLCVRYYAQPDGIMLTEECPAGFQTTRRRFLSRLAAAAFGLLGLRCRDAAAGSSRSPAASRPRSIQGSPAVAPQQSPVALQGEAVVATHPPVPQHTMGKIAMPAARAQPLMGRPVNPSHPPVGTTSAPVGPRALMGGVALPPRPGSKPKPPRQNQAHGRRGKK